MTAINVCVVPDPIHVFTDGGQIEIGKNKLEAISSKIGILPEYNAVVTANGYAFVEKLLIGTVAQGRFENFDALAVGFQDLIKRAIVHGAQYGAPSTWRDVEIVLAGWSSRESAPKALLFESCNNFGGKEITRFIRPALPDLRFETGDIAQSGLEIMRAQRAAAFPVKDNSSGGFIKDSYPRRVVHGFAQHTIVTRNSIETRILERWPDKIGLIDSRAEAMCSTLMETRA